MAAIDNRIKIQGLSFGYSSYMVFHDFSWASEKKIAIIEGPSGCGKTTFLRILSGQLLPAKFLSWNVPSPSRIILQEDGLLPWLTASGNLALATEWRGFHSVPAYLEDMAGLVLPYARQIVATLSFGQRRLLELLRVLCCPTSIILLDEPLNFLDSSRRKVVVESIGRLAEQGFNFVISSHYESDFNQFQCSRYRFTGDMPYQTLDRVELS